MRCPHPGETLGDLGHLPPHCTLEALGRHHLKLPKALSPTEESAGRRRARLRRCSLRCCRSRSGAERVRRRTAPINGSSAPCICRLPSQSVRFGSKSRGRPGRALPPRTRCVLDSACPTPSGVTDGGSSGIWEIEALRLVGYSTRPSLSTGSSAGNLRWHRPPGRRQERDLPLEPRARVYSDVRTSR